MHYYTTLFYQSLIATLLLTALGACNKLLEVPLRNEIGIDEAFSDSTTAVAAVTGIYNNMITHYNLEWGGIAYQAARSADEAVFQGGPDPFAGNSLLYTDVDIAAMWKQGFNSLLTINTCIGGLQSAGRLSPALHDQLLGESLFDRALVNFYLVNCFGDALPLVTTPNVQVNQVAPSVPRQQHYQQIITDLQQAQQLLPDAYVSDNRVRPNRMAATALLARVYVYQSRFADAIREAGTVIGDNRYSPLPALSEAFLYNSRETIWQIMPTTFNNVTWAVPDVDRFQRTPTSLTPPLLAAFERGDRRLQYWVKSNTVSGTNYITVNKYQNEAQYGPTTRIEYYVVLRLAEQYLIRAEAYTRLGQTKAAIADLNVVRSRAGLSLLPDTLNQQQCMGAVEHERQVELFCEWGHRWFDLKRWPGIDNPAGTRADEVLSAIKTGWQPAAQWYPVPLQELRINQYLVQNPGYPTK